MCDHRLEFGSWPCHKTVAMASALGPMAALPPPFTANAYLGEVPALTIPAMAIETQRVQHVTILNCARYPHDQNDNLGQKQAHGFIFVMKNGRANILASHYTTGKIYYHAVWDGVGFLIARALFDELLELNHGALISQRPASLNGPKMGGNVPGIVWLPKERLQRIW